MTLSNTTPEQARDALEDAVRALRDIAELDPDRAAINDPAKVARRSLERIAKMTNTSVNTSGHTPRPTESIF